MFPAKPDGQIYEVPPEKYGGDNAIIKDPENEADALEIIESDFEEEEEEEEEEDEEDDDEDE